MLLEEFEDDMKLHQLRFQKGAYLAFELGKQTRALLLKRFAPKFSRVICHHVTIERRLTEERLKEIQDTLGESPDVYSTGYLSGEGVECFAVEINGIARRPDGLFYHVTHSVEPPKKPVDSNGVMTAAHGKPDEKFEPLKLSGAWRLIKG